MTTPTEVAAGEAREAAEEAAAAIVAAAGRHDVAVVLGSGWAATADALGEPDWEFPVAELPGFPVPTALGHGGTVRSVPGGTGRVLVLLGRPTSTRDTRSGRCPTGSGPRSPPAAGR